MVCPATILDHPKSQEPPSVWPPDDDDGGGGGGGGDSGGPHQPDSGPPVSAARLAVLVICGSAVMLFAGILSALVILRREAGAWPPNEAPTLLRDLWTSTGIILSSSLAGFWAMRASRPEKRHVLVRRIGITWLLGLGFCLSQVALWSSLVEAGIVLRNADNFAALFYMITVLHVLHVLGGMYFLGRCWLQGRASADFRQLRASCANCLIYWHFVGLIWCVLFGFLHSS